jgi:hypothetical protein
MPDERTPQSYIGTDLTSSVQTADHYLMIPPVIRSQSEEDLLVGHRTSWGILPPDPRFLASLGALSLAELHHCCEANIHRVRRSLTIPLKTKNL